MVTLISEVKNNLNYKQCLDHGFIGLVDAMPSTPGLGDGAIVQAARVSYGEGTRKVSEDRGLIRYLLRHQHTTPFEMAEFKFHVKLPIFVARQWVRHRTASINEYSGRYSVMSNEFYIPEPADCAPQSTVNNQGRSGNMTEKEASGVRWLIDANNDHCHKTYETLLGNYNDDPDEALYSPYREEDGWFDDDYPGLARELSRMVLPVNNYTEWYWKSNLHNILRFLKLRNDPHAQKEIQVYAQAMEELITPYVPLTMEAFKDYVKGAASLSRMEVELLKNLIGNKPIDESLAESLGMSKREIREFKERFDC